MRITFNQVRDLAKQMGFIFERNNRKYGEDIVRYDLCTNTVEEYNGITLDFRTLNEAISELKSIKMMLSNK